LSPKAGEVYNIGGCRENSASILEVIDKLKVLGYSLNFSYNETARVGDHICYISDMSKFKKDYPNWSISKNLNTILNEIIASQKVK
jgi:CDP-paratose 2-epimerase